MGAEAPDPSCRAAGKIKAAHDGMAYKGVKGQPLAIGVFACPGRKRPDKSEPYTFFHKGGSMGAKGVLSVYFTNGKVQWFEFTRAEDTANVGSRIQEIMKSNQLILDLEDKTLIIPFASIQYIEIAPPLQKLPLTAIKDIRQIQE
jgi:hypothetical protein